MQTITGTMRMAGNDAVIALTEIQIQERVGRLAGNLVGTFTTDGNGDFSFQLKPGAFYLRFGSDAVPFRVVESSGTTTIGQLVEAA